MPQTEKGRENVLRRKLDSEGYRLSKSRARDPDDLKYGGYQITDLQVGGVVAGWGNAGRGFDLDLDGVEAFLKT